VKSDSVSAFPREFGRRISQTTPLSALKILFTSYLFSPSLGGIETVSSLLASEFVRHGHEVVLVTTTREDDHVSRPYTVVRAPGAGELIGLTRWCEVLFQSNISLELAWPLLFIRRPWILSHQTMLLHPVENLSLRGRLKHYLFRFASHAAISHSIADSLPVPSIILGNPYSSETFKLMPEISRDRELVYLGRLVSDKGIDLLLEAVAELRQRGFTPRLTIIGSGPESTNLQELARRLQISSQVEFTGPKKGAELARTLNAHQNHDCALQVGGAVWRRRPRRHRLRMHRHRLKNRRIARGGRSLRRHL
jgi:glycogen(starch) synthase